jgi:hypothetical protein
MERSPWALKTTLSPSTSLKWVGFAFINSKQATHGTQSMGFEDNFSPSTALGGVFLLL